MTIHLPGDLESPIRSLVQGGRFASEDEFVAEAVRAYLQRNVVAAPAAPTPGDPAANDGLGSIGFMRDHADELEEIVAEAYRNRLEDPWREFDLE